MRFEMFNIDFFNVVFAVHEICNIISENCMFNVCVFSKGRDNGIIMYFCKPLIINLASNKKLQYFFTELLVKYVIIPCSNNLTTTYYMKTNQIY